MHNNNTVHDAESYDDVVAERDHYRQAYERLLTKWEAVQAVMRA